MADSAYAHFIGVGGAGMSGIALVLHQRGVAVTGSDLKESRYSRALEKSGIPVTIGHHASNVGDPAVVVASSAIPESNPELAEARLRGIPVWPRARMLAHLAGERLTVAVAGTHGKTTTSSMIATMLDRMGQSPTFLIGGEVDGYGVNASAGSGPHYVVEADESDGSFVYLRPDVATVTNMEADHLDHYDSFEHIEDAFEEFMGACDPEGALVVCGDDERLSQLAERCDAPVVSYGFSDTCGVRCTDLGRDSLGRRFELTMPDGSRVQARTNVPGLHMVVNGCGALATAWALGLDIDAAAAALSTFTGVRRRFDHIGTVQGVTIVDDYAHHPTEVRATIQAARELDFDRIWVLFQPHRYSRTAALSRDFATAFDTADRVVLMDVYSAGEVPIPGVSGKTIVDAVLGHAPRSRVAWLPHSADVIPFLAAETSSGDLVMTMGAGDVTQIGPELVRALEGSEEGLVCR